MKKSKVGKSSKYTPFHLEKEGNTIRISGRIDVYSSNELYNHLLSLCDVKENTSYAIELEKIEQLDSGGVQALTHFNTGNEQPQCAD